MISDLPHIDAYEELQCSLAFDVVFVFFFFFFDAEKYIYYSDRTIFKRKNHRTGLLLVRIGVMCSRTMFFMVFLLES
jgi:hypothetical protein